ncbi:GNAT family N-acetyltransferase [Microbacterium protaetiae]|uniref:GNAT family N-acetyltransferase n=1 Tax=Microbacterium protaetiae TaxID=2509458 RepID=A0A4V0YCY7_9MICO|nr:GNAT family N-acetyltransferase [Microbacterium protaetiae]QAY58851.1 GNAT family N-acetyltransferase [Microbacterium protaetiae]
MSTNDLRVLALPHGLASAAASITTRPVATTDRDRLADIYLAAYPAQIGAADLADARTEMDATFAGAYGTLRFDASGVSLDRHGEVTGAILVTTRSIWDEGVPGPFVIDLFVDPTAQGHGHGRALVQAAIDACTATGDETLSLRVGEGTTPAAHALYASLGFATPVA